MAANPLTARIDAGRDAYGIKLDIFEGPLDLLLFLIRKSEIDIYDIPIAAIAKQYLEYVDLMQQLNLEQAGDFVVMAATLMKIKSRMLLPSEPGDGEEGEEDPRDELVRRLLEYQQTKEVATWMEDRQERFRDVFYRGTAMDREDPAEAEDSIDVWREVGLFDLMKAFQQAILVASQVRSHHVEPILVTTEERVRVIVDVMERRGRASFADLVSGLSRITLVVTFVAVLEMVKAGRLVARQSGSSGDIWLYPASADSAVPPEALGDLDAAGLAESIASRADAAPTGEEARRAAEALGITPRKPPPWARKKGGSSEAPVGGDPREEAVGDAPNVDIEVAGPVVIRGDESNALVASWAGGVSGDESNALVASWAGGVSGDESNALVASLAFGVSGDEPHVARPSGVTMATIPGPASVISAASEPPALTADVRPAGIGPGTARSRMGDEPHAGGSNPGTVRGDEPNTAGPSVEGTESNG